MLRTKDSKFNFARYARLKAGIFPACDAARQLPLDPTWKMRVRSTVKVATGDSCSLRVAAAAADANENGLDLVKS